jgi:hypothetical protein
MPSATSAEGAWPAPSLLCDKKHTGSFETHKECEAFLKGVAAVVNHILEAKDA